MAKNMQNIRNTLGMINVGVVAVSHNRPNVKYCVIQKSSTLEETFAPLVEEVKLHLGLHL